MKGKHDKGFTAYWIRRKSDMELKDIAKAEKYKEKQQVEDVIGEENSKKKIKIMTQTQLVLVHSSSYL